MTSEERVNEVGFCGPVTRSLRVCETVCHKKVVDEAEINSKRRTILLTLQREEKQALGNSLLHQLSTGREVGYLGV